VSSVAASRAGWTRYDDFQGPALDPDRWEPLTLGGIPRLEPDARTTVKDGVLTVEIPEFTSSDASNQMLDNTKHVIFATQAFPLPPGGVARFAVQLRADVGDGSGDYRQGFASLNVADTTTGTHQVFNILSNGQRVFAEQEVLGVPGQPDPFTRVIEDPFFFTRTGTSMDDGFHHCEIEVNRARSEVVWSVDHRVLHQASGLADLPDELHMACGIFTLLGIGEGEGSCHGQGGRASWRNFEYSLSAG
jgi:Family of unknown function (DUF6081)